jgi:flagellar capping protein FliD
MIQQLDNAFSSNKSSLESLGITRNTDSTLSIDNQKFENAVSKDFNSLSRAFNPQNGLAKRASDIGGNMMYSPANYSKTTQLNQAGLTGMYVDMFI